MHLGKTVEQAQDEISSAEFTDWIAYANEEPFGYPVDNFRMGMSTASLVNTIRSTIPKVKGKPRPKAAKPSDFYPAQKKAGPDLTPEQRTHIRKKQAKRAKK